MYGLNGQLRMTVLRSLIFKPFLDATDISHISDVTSNADIESHFLGSAYAGVLAVVHRQRFRMLSSPLPGSSASIRGKSEPHHHVGHGVARVP